MTYITEDQIREIGINWNQTIPVIGEALQCIKRQDFSQPIKPYLRYRDLRNRIIAMPAFVGGNINMAGIKWIASFPGNIAQGIPRAHSVVILNQGDTGEPVAIICGALLSIIRTASVSGWVISYFDKIKKWDKIKIGITGFGPIGRHHADMCMDLLGDKIDRLLIYDIRPVDAALKGNNKIEIVNSWEEAYEDADIFITCTVSGTRYINKKPKPGSLHLNVSLRDYTPEASEWFKGAMIVDDWNEVCREKTDIEIMHLEKNLQKENTLAMADMLTEDFAAKHDSDLPVMFNPMGMAVFDIAIGHYYYKAMQQKENLYASTAKAFT